MDSNPYETPAAESSGQRSSAVQASLELRPDLADLDVDELQEIARAQRKLISMLLISLLSFTVLLCPMAMIPFVNLIVAAFVVSALVQLRRAVSGESTSPILIVALLVVPFLFWFFALPANQKATRRLRAAGIRVGLFGADNGQFKRLRELVAIQRHALATHAPRRESRDYTVPERTVELPSFLGKKNGRPDEG